MSDHLPEYATLKAMGYSDLYLLIVVFQEALILALLGYLPGLSVSLGLYTLTKIYATGTRAHNPVWCYCRQAFRRCRSSGYILSLIEPKEFIFT